jgi:hypothetical protein
MLQAIYKAVVNFIKWYEQTKLIRWKLLKLQKETKQAKVVSARLHRYLKKTQINKYLV